jgi:hypothetical protein
MPVSPASTGAGSSVASASRALLRGGQDADAVGREPSVEIVRRERPLREPSRKRRALHWWRCDIRNVQYPSPLVSDDRTQQQPWMSAWMSAWISARDHGVVQRTAVAMSATVSSAGRQAGLTL